jgi:FtsH-binding integral membrane protein
MTCGILLTAWVAFLVSENPELMSAIFGNPIAFWMLMIAELGAVLFLSAALPRISAITATVVYLLYSALSGLTLSIIFVAYTHQSIAAVFGVTAFSFAGLSAIGFFTKRDLGPVGAFCSMGLFGLVGFGILSLFIPSLRTNNLQMASALIGVVVFSGLTAYDTQKIKAMNPVGSEDSEMAAKGAIYGALTLYLDFINLFLSLLRLFGDRRRD